MGMAFTDALIDHADVHVTLVDRRHAAGGHWLDAYPFVQLHQASVFYGVASTVLGSGAVQRSGPEAGLQERGRESEIPADYDEVLPRRFLRSGGGPTGGGGEIGDPRVLRRRPPPALPRLGGGHFPGGKRLPRRWLLASRDVAVVGRDGTGRRSAPRRRRGLSLADHPRHDASS